LKSSFTFPSWTVPFALLLLCLVSFGLLIPWLGFYWDDWPVILIGRLQGASGYEAFYQYDRPFSAWTYILFTPILGTQSFPWHIFSLLLRWLAVLGMWWSLRLLWPHHRRETTWIAFLFAVYPIFDQQPISVAYSQHWISYALYFFSIGAMLQSLRAPRRRFLWTGLSLMAAVLHLLTLEYFLGLELLRPMVLWLVAGESEPTRRTRFYQTFRRWLPYLLLMIAYILWRLFFLELAAEDPNRPEILYNLFTQPIPTLIDLLQTILRDMLYFLIGAWFDTLQPAQITLREPVSLFSLVLSVLTTVVVSTYLYRLLTNRATNRSDQRLWVHQAIAIGLAAILLGTFPAWVTGRQAVIGLYGSRFGLAAMFGASVLLVGAFDWLTPRTFQRIILLSVLIGLGVGFHIRNANDFRWIQIDQNRFYWQLYWRAPYLKPNTAILSDGELFSYVGTYSTSAALNLLYSQPSDSSNLAYWFFDLDRDFEPRQLQRLNRDIPIDTTFRSFSYSGSSLSSLVIRYASEAGQCLRVFAPSSARDFGISDLIKAVIPLSNLSRIDPQPLAENYPPTDIFGAEPEHTWCYFYQKAELARQSGAWQTIAELGARANRLGYTPNDPQEWWPFIEAYAHTGLWEKAQDLTLQVYEANEDLGPGLCSLWDQIQIGNDREVATGTQRELLNERLRCTP